MPGNRTIGARYPVPLRRSAAQPCCRAQAAADRDTRRHPPRTGDLSPDGDTLLEEIANAITHGIGAGLAIAALALLTVFAAGTGNPLAVIAVVLYGASLIFMFMVSTLYHSVTPGRLKERLLTGDHCAIFLLIAGTYTPITLIVMTGWQGWFLFGLIWALAIGGIVLRLVWLRSMHPAFLVIYVAMGWLGFLFADNITARLGGTGLDLILIGGLFYTLGLGFYAWRGLPFNHALWHISVVAGGIFHFFAMVYYVVPQAA